MSSREPTGETEFMESQSRQGARLALWPDNCSPSAGYFEAQRWLEKNHTSELIQVCGNLQSNVDTEFGWRLAARAAQADNGAAWVLP